MATTDLSQPMTGSKRTPSGTATGRRAGAGARGGSEPQLPLFGGADGPRAAAAAARAAAAAAAMAQLSAGAATRPAAGGAKPARGVKPTRVAGPTRGAGAAPSASGPAGVWAAAAATAGAPAPAAPAPAGKKTLVVPIRRETSPGTKATKAATSKARASAEDDASLPGIPDAVPEEAPRQPRRNVETAVTMAAKQREISVSEFFTKNRHLLGFDNSQKALTTTVKEAVDNALDACEEAGILPDIQVIITQISENRFRVAVEDNGPGIVKAQIPNIFAKLLYGSKFHTLKQSRGQQGIGISAAGMYGSLTTGKPVCITSRTGARQPAHYYELQIDTRKNNPQIVKDAVVEWPLPSGTRVEIELEGTYKRGRRSVDDYVERTALANPHASFAYTMPSGETIRYERVVGELPKETLAIKPHPHGVELGVLIKMLRETKSRNLAGALQADFSRVSASVAQEIVKAAGLRAEMNPHRMTHAEVEQLCKVIPTVKIMAPPSSCLSPIGSEQILAGLRKHVPADFYDAVTRAPLVYRGMPFQVEVGLAYGGQLPAEEAVDLRRYANRVPLTYQQGSCAIFNAAVGIDWKNYGLQQSRGALPVAPMVLFIHIASVWVPFTSESKEAIAHYPEVIKEIRLGLMEVGRRLGLWVRARRRAQIEGNRRGIILKYIPHLVIGLQQILKFSDKERDRTVAELTGYLERTRKNVAFEE